MGTLEIPPVSPHDAMFMPELGFAPMPAIARVLGRFDRPHLEAFMEVAVDLLDLLDGDPDAADGSDTEDDFALTDVAQHFASHDGPGCTISDPGGPTWTEWHTRGRHKGEPGINDRNGRTAHEDDEMDDHGEDDDPDHEHDGREEEHEGY